MAKNSTFDIKIAEGYNIQFNQDATFENFIGQFQQFCPKLLCIIDGTYLRYYEKISTIPINIRFDYKQRRGELTEYYFRNIDDDTLYCVFGRESAKIFYPRIDEVDPNESVFHPNGLLSKGLQPESSNTNIVQKDTKNILAIRPPIIQQIKQTIPLFRDVSCDIIIIDKGVKLKFPNPNYPIEIKTYYPS